MNELCGIVVCVGYDDYLEHTLKWATGQFDKLFVVTSLEDEKTQNACRGRAHCFPTDAFYENGDVFNKARAINKALMHMKPTDWVLFFDADIILAENFGSRIRNAKLKREGIYYTMRRTMFLKTMRRDLAQLYANPLYRTKLKVEHGGFDAHPWGYFQLVNAKASVLHTKGWRWMAEHHTAANEYDTEFHQMWSKANMIKLQDDFAVVHMAHGPRGTNWRGRKSQRIDEGVQSGL